MDTNAIILEKFINDHTLEAAQIVQDLGVEEMAAVLEELPLELSVKLLQEMQAHNGARCLELMAPDTTVKLIEALDFTSGELLLRASSVPLRESVLQKISKEKAQQLRTRLSYTENSVGASMDTSILYFPGETLVEEALQIVRGQGRLDYPYVYITGENKKLEGVVRLQDLITAGAHLSIKEVAVEEVPVIYADTRIELIADHEGWAGYLALPVVNESGVLVGVIGKKTIHEIHLKTGSLFSKQAITAGNELGELFRIGLTGLLRSAGQ